MQSDKPKVRSDYHELYSSSTSSSHLSRFEPWLKTVLFIGVGFILGIVYTKLFLMSPGEVLALSEAKPIVKQKGNAEREKKLS